MTRGSVQATITIAAAIWAALLLAHGTTLSTDFLRPYSLVVAGTVIVLNAFDRYLWRIKPFARLVHTPDLTGTWRGVLTSSRKDPNSGKAIAPIQVFS